MEYSGKSRSALVKIIAKEGWLARYNGQYCNAIFYEGNLKPQIDTEQLAPPFPRWQSVDLKDIEQCSNLK